VGLTWLASKHPYIAAGIVAWLLIVIVCLTRWIWRALKALFRGPEKDWAGQPS